MATPSDSEDHAYINHAPTYHDNKHATYALPNDTPEHVRLETQARHFSAIMNCQIIHSPLPSAIQNARMLDVGCGTGIITDELGARFPSAQVYGLDLSDVPELRPHPPNLTFLRDKNIDLFDLIFTRLLVCGLNDWPGYVRKCYTLAKPAGHAEMHDIDWKWFETDSITGDIKVVSDSWRWLELINRAAQAKGMDFQPSSKLSSWMSDAGFENIKVTEYRWPMGGQGEKNEVWREWGGFEAQEIVWLCWHVIPKLLVDYNEDDIQELRREMKQTLAPREGMHWMMRVVTGRKPQ